MGRGSIGGRRGASKESSAGISVTFQGKTTDYYFKRVGKINYVQEGISGMPKETPNNISKAEFEKRAKRNGGTVKQISKKEQKEKEKKYKEYRKKADKMLDESSVQDRHFVKGSRMSRISNRARKRK